MARLQNVTLADQFKMAEATLYAEGLQHVCFHRLGRRNDCYNHNRLLLADKI